MQNICDLTAFCMVHDAVQISNISDAAEFTKGTGTSARSTLQRRFSRRPRLEQARSRQAAECLHLDKAECTTLTDRKQFCFPDAVFDTVIDTFGLCSCADPVQALRQMSQVPHLLHAWPARAIAPASQPCLSVGMLLYTPMRSRTRACQCHCGLEHM